MRFNPIPLIAAILFLPLMSLAQNDPKYSIMLKTGPVYPVANISPEKIADFIQHSNKTSDKAFAVLQFEKIPTEKQKLELSKAGIALLDYIPNNAYTVTITGTPAAEIFLQANARAVLTLSPAQKIQPALFEKTSGAANVRVSFPRSFSLNEVVKELINRNFNISASTMKEYRILELNIPLQRLEELASLPFIEWVEAVPGPPQVISQFWTQWGRDGVKASLLNAPLSQGGKRISKAAA